MNNQIPEGMIAFDYEEAIKRPEDVVTRDGRPVKIAGYNPEAGGLFAIAGWIQGIGTYWAKDGSTACASLSSLDLFLRVKTVDIYRNDYGPDESQGMRVTSLESAIANTRQGAKCVTRSTYQGDVLIRVEICHKY